MHRHSGLEASHPEGDAGARGDTSLASRNVGFLVFARYVSARIRHERPVIFKLGEGSVKEASRRAGSA
jgi:hypothetical protein